MHEVVSKEIEDLHMRKGLPRYYIRDAILVGERLTHRKAEK